MLFLALALLFSGPAAAQNEAIVKEVMQMPWQASPDVGQLGTVAGIAVAKDLQFLGANYTRRFLELNGNPPREDTYTLARQDFGWFAVFGFDPSGYVKDDETIDPDALLATLKEQNADDIEERKKRGLPALAVLGWAVVPHYDAATRRLEWGMRLADETGDLTVNYTIRLLGRSGVMSATLVSDPQTLEANVAEFHTALAGFNFNAGERYAEYRPGDKLAEYGLAALVVGGAAAAAGKFGLLKTFGVAIVAGGAAVLGGVTAVFRRIFRRKPTA